METLKEKSGHGYRRVFYGSIGLILACGLSAVYSAYLLRHQWSDYVFHSGVVDYAQDLTKSVSYLESAKLGYVLTGDSSYLNHFEEKCQEVLYFASKIVEAVPNQSPLKDEVSELFELSKQRVKRFKETVEQAKSSSWLRSHVAVLPHEGRILTERIQEIIKDITAEEAQVLANSVAQAYSNLQLTYLIIFAMSLFAFLGVFYFYRRLQGDLDKRTLVESQLLKNEKELVAARDHADKSLQIKNEFLANISHEIRTPMNGVIGMTSLLSGLNLDSEAREYVNNIRLCGEHLLTLINDVLDFSKIESGKLQLESEDFAPRQLVEEIIDLLGVEAAKKSIVFRCNVDKKVPEMLVGDPSRLRQILLNFTSNAIKFTHAGYVEIRLSSVGDADFSRFRFEVRDSGIGISEENIKKLFTPFTQADASTTKRYGGTGLGLAICKKLVEMMDGEIGVDSKEGIGSVFWFEVTLKQSTRFDHIRGSTISFGSVSNQSRDPYFNRFKDGVADNSAKRILIVDDNQLNQKIAGRMIEKMGYKYDVASDGREAVALSKTNPFSLILMDCLMPEMDGYEASRVLREREKLTVPIIAMTANVLNGERERCLEAGMNDYLPKPVRFEDLQCVVDKWVGQKSM